MLRLYFTSFFSKLEFDLGTFREFFNDYCQELKHKFKILLQLFE